MIVNPAVRNLIREGKAHQIPTVIQSSGALGMVTFDQSLASAFLEQSISKQTALDLAHDPAEFRRLARV
jgi:twitching motility protein PilT